MGLRLPAAFASAALAALAWPGSALADVAACHSDWAMHDGEGLVSWGYDIGSHGQIDEYAWSTIPDPDGPGWVPAPDPDAIDYDLAGNSTLCGQLECRWGAEFTYFKTLVYLPPQLSFSEAWVDVTLVDDGVRMTVFSDQHPGGVTDPNGYAFLGGGVSANLLPYMDTGADGWSWVVLTHVDDCCSQSLITGVSFKVFVDGRPVAVPTDCDVVDDDGDGYPEAGGDCDDADPAVFPFMPEAQNGVDDDCDGLVDEGTDAFDDDGDGQSELDGDCDDSNGNITPGAPEQCDQHDIDYDCDGCPGSTDPDCGGSCGLQDDDDGGSGDDDDSADGEGGDDDDSASTAEPAGDDDDSAAFVPPPRLSCDCYQAVPLSWLVWMPLLVLRRRR